MKLKTYYNSDFDLNSRRSSGKEYPSHKDGDRTWFCGWVCEEGAVGLALKSEQNVKSYYKAATEYNEKSDYPGAYFELPLSDTELDIVMEVCKADDPKTLLNSLMHYASDEFLIPEEQREYWDDLKKIIPIEDRK